MAPVQSKAVRPGLVPVQIWFIPVKCPEWRTHDRLLVLGFTETKTRQTCWIQTKVYLLTQILHETGHEKCKCLDTAGSRVVDRVAKVFIHRTLTEAQSFGSASLEGIFFTNIKANRVALWFHWCADGCVMVGLQC